jgi:hypothetical protein
MRLPLRQITAYVSVRSMAESLAVSIEVYPIDPPAWRRQRRLGSLGHAHGRRYARIMCGRARLSSDVVTKSAVREACRRGFTRFHSQMCAPARTRCRGVLFAPQPSQPIGDLDRHCRGLRSPAEATPPRRAISRDHCRNRSGRQRQSGGQNVDSNHPTAA